MSKNHRKVVIAIDPNSPQTTYVLTWAVENFLSADRDQVEVVTGHLLNADYDPNATDNLYVGEYLTEIEQETEKKLLEKLEKQTDILRDAKIQYSIKLLTCQTDTRKCLSDHIEDVKADVLLIGNRDLSHWKRMWLGSFCDFLVHSVHCPVVVIKPPRDRETTA
ncbi:hypothetical protein K7432_007276 [Basidiobolus ranarum]|uniref:UspA domain-containing protein n=1 Tax=Basidiobolus ranarum TaxID=34480 RepID=A0ABR2WTK8_9FUNG